MKLEKIKSRLAELEEKLKTSFLAQFSEFERDGRVLSIHVSRQLFRNLSKARLWKSRHMLSTLRNAEYGFEEQDARSRGGKDGIFLLDRNFKPPNEMMHKIYAGYLDKTGKEADLIAKELGCSKDDLAAVRLVSHHMRLLGVMLRREDRDLLVLVDYDRSK